MKQPNYSRLRRKVIVDPEFQRALTVRAVAFLLFMLVGMSVGLFLPLVNEIGKANADTGEPDDPAVVMLYMHEHFWPLALSFLILAILGVVVISHRIAAPLVRVKRDMHAVGEGVFPRPLKTRDKDYLQTEVEVLNEMVASLAQRVDDMKRVSGELQQAIAVLQESAEGSSDQESRDALAITSARAIELDSLVNQFRREGDPVPDGHIPTAQESPRTKVLAES